jgi:hypothetical protein
MSDDIVFFYMPDGTKVSNDPRWLMQQGKSLSEIQTEGTPNTGYATPHYQDELISQGQGNADTSNNLGAMVTGASVQHSDRKMAREEGYDANTPEVTSEPIDINKAVQEARDQRQAAREAEYERQIAAGSDEESVGDPSVGYEEWNAKQLTAEVKRRKDAGRKLETHKNMKKADVAQLLTLDDEAQAQEAAASSASMTG